MRKYLFMLLLAGVVSITYGNALVPADSTAPQQAVLSVGGIGVSPAEFTWKMRGLRTACYNYFTNRYGVYDGADFWLHTFGGEVPVAWLRKKALQEISAEKRTLLLMQSYGVMNDFSFGHFLTQWQQENKNRQQRVAQGELIYGNISFDVYSYYACLNANAWLETKRQWLLQSAVDEATLKRYYDTIKEQQLKKTPTITVTLLKKERSTGKQSDAIVVFEPSGRKADELQWGEIFARSMALRQPGDRSEWFTNETGDLCQVICRALEEHGYIPFEDAIENVRSSYAESCLQRELEEDHPKIPIRVNRKMLDLLFL